MKNLIILLTLLAAGTAAAQQYRTVKASEINGTWKLEMDIARLVKEETRNEDNPLGKAIARGVSGFIESITDDLDVRFTFNKGGEMDITTRYANEKLEHDNGKWSINKSGQLVIDGDADGKVSFDNSDGWLMHDGVLHPINDDGKVNEHIRLVRLKSGSAVQ